MKWRLAPAVDKSELNRNVIDPHFVDASTCLPIPASLKLVGRGGNAPPKSEDGGFTGRSNILSATCRYILGHSDWIRTSIPRIRSQSLESDQVLLNGVKAINYFDKSALLNP